MCISNDQWGGCLPHNCSTPKAPKLKALQACAVRSPARCLGPQAGEQQVSPAAPSRRHRDPGRRMLGVEGGSVGLAGCSVRLGGHPQGAGPVLLVLWVLSHVLSRCFPVPCGCVGTPGSSSPGDPLRAHAGGRRTDSSRFACPTRDPLRVHAGGPSTGCRRPPCPPGDPLRAHAGGRSTGSRRPPCPLGDGLRAHAGGQSRRSRGGCLWQAVGEGPCSLSPSCPPSQGCGAQNTLSCLLRDGRLGASSPSPWPLEMERADSVRAENRVSRRVSRQLAGSRP